MLVPIDIVTQGVFTLRSHTLVKHECLFVETKMIINLEQ